MCLKIRSFRSALRSFCVYFLSYALITLKNRSKIFFFCWKSFFWPGLLEIEWPVQVYWLKTDGQIVAKITDLIILPPGFVPSVPLIVHRWIVWGKERKIDQKITSKLNSIQLVWSKKISLDSLGQRLRNEKYYWWNQIKNTKTKMYTQIEIKTPKNYFN